MGRELLDEDALAASSVVANCAMNRERQLAGVNSYTRELGFNPFEWLRNRIGMGAAGVPATVAWLDLCCGTGRALIQAAEQARHEGIAEHFRLVGVDLVDAFDPHTPSDTIDEPPSHAANGNGFVAALSLRETETAPTLTWGAVGWLFRVGCCAGRSSRSSQATQLSSSWH